MPIYDYRCEACGGFEHTRPVAERDVPLACPVCARPAQRVLVAAPRRVRADTDPGAGGGYARLSHAGGCACCTRPARRGGGR